MKLLYSSASAPIAARSVLAAAVAAFALAGCANYAGIKSDKQIAQPQNDALQATQSVPAQGGQWPSLEWAKQVGDPQLPQRIEEALAGSPSIAQAQARIAKASSYIESSRSALYPKVNGSYSWSRELFSGNALYPPPYGGTRDRENKAAAGASGGLPPWGQNPPRADPAGWHQEGPRARLHAARHPTGGAACQAHK